jgi:hypothetical protein
VPAALSPVPPDDLRAIFERHGYRLIDETDFNWILYKESVSHPIIPLPKRGPCVSLQVMDNVLFQAEMSDQTYLRLKEEINR